MAEGIDWAWKSFPEYLDAIERKSHAFDVAAQVPHAALRFYVMGERGADHTARPTPEEIERMGALTREAIDAGALGFTTSRTRTSGPATVRPRRVSPPVRTSYSASPALWRVRVTACSRSGPISPTRRSSGPFASA